MQEEVENRTVNLAISTTKLTGRTIIAGIRKYLQHREKVKMKKARDPAVHGKQSVKQLLGQNQGATNVEIDKESIRDFEKLAKKYGVDFAVRKDKSVDPPRFLVFVRSKDADALDAICKEHQARALTNLFGICIMIFLIMPENKASSLLYRKSAVWDFRQKQQSWLKS